MSIDAAIAIAWDVLKSVVPPIKRQFGYVIYSKRHAQDLQKEVEELACEVVRVHSLVEAARNNLRNVDSRVTEWHASAEKALKEARDLLRDFQEASKTCCYETLPDPKCRYQFSRKAKDKIEVIQRLTQKCREFKESNDISFSNPAPGNVAALTPAKDNGVFESRASIIRDIMDALADDSNSVVGVYGMGGVGKSTLLADVERRIMENESFVWVTKADVSENPDIKKIQGEIAHSLSLTEIKNEEIVSVRAGLLRKRLENEERMKKKVLIILDNLWKGLDLKSVGIPCGHDNKVIGCKLLLTSRFQDVLRREMGCNRDFCLEELKDEEAKKLFESTVGDKVHDDPFKSLVDEAIHKCAGLPFLIIAMSNIFRDADFPEWKDVLRQIEMSTNKGISERINEMLQLSYNRFTGEEGKEVKSLLRLCVVYGVSKPSLENLVRYGVGSKLFREDSSMEEVRDRMSSLVQTLKASSLLLKDDENVDGFKIHDLVRGFVALVASRDDPLLVLKDDNNKSVIELPKDKLKSCTAVCFPYVNMKELPEELDCPKMRIFLLFTNKESLKIPDSYFNSMKKLMVLHLSHVHLTHSPSPFHLLENLHTLCLDGCSLDNVAVIGELKGLHVLSFVNSKIRRLPKEIGQLVELMLLDLNHCSQLKIIEPGVLGSLMKLEELYMENSFDRWNAVEQNPPTNAKLIELNNLKNLCTLHVSIPDPSGLPEDLNVKKLTKYKIQIGDVMRWQSRKGSSILELKLYPISNILQKGFMQTFLGKSDDLFLDGLNGIEQSICELSQEGFPKLKHLHVENSPSINYVLQSPFLTNFRKLESLLLKNLINFEKICNYSISSKSFSALKVMKVECCDKMEILFPLSLLRELPQLEEIQAANCHLMREIAEVDDRGKVELRNLHVLKLLDLPNIKNFFTTGTAPSSSTLNVQVGTQVAFFNGQQVSIPSLESLTMAGLPNLEELWTDESSMGLSNLQFLVVSSCKSLSKVINSRSLIKLQKLHTLTVEACISMQEIFDLDGTGVNIETLSELNTIYICGLPSLRCVWNKNPCGFVRFHNLKKLQVYDCDNLGFLFFPSMVESLVQLRELSIWRCKNMEAIIMEEEGLRVETLETLVFPMLTRLNLGMLESLTCFSHRKCTPKAQGEDNVKLHSPILFNQEVAFPNLETLEISDMDNIEIIWDNQVAVNSFHKLKSLEVWRCDKLLNIVPSCILGWLKSLESLEVNLCDLLEVVFKLQPLNPLDGYPVAHLSLKRLELHGLPELKCVWDKELHNQVKFQSLCFVTVSRCKSLTSLFPASVAIHLTQLEELRVQSCDLLEVVFKLQPLNPLDGHPVANFPLKRLELDGLPKLKCVWDKELHNQVKFRCLRFVTVSGCKSLTSRFLALVLVHLTQLEELKIRSCDWLEVLKLQTLNPLEGHPVAHLPLKRLELYELPELQCIWDEKLHSQVKFQCLRFVTVSRCKSLTSLFPASVVVHLTQLEELNVLSCDLLEVVFKLQPSNPLDGHTIFHLPLKRLKLRELPKLKCIWDKELHNQVKFQCLRFVTVSGCKSLTSLFLASVVVHLTQLEELEVQSCDLLEVVFKSQPLNPLDGHPVAHLSLERLELHGLPELKCVWDKELHNQVKFQCLRFVTVSGCKSLTSLFPASVVVHLTQLEELKVRSCDLLEVVFKSQPLNPLDGYPVAHLSLKRLELDGLPELKCVWDKELHNQVKFQCLRFVIVSRCKSLTSLFPALVAIHLTQLEELEISECGIVELIGNEGPIPKVVFPRLTSLKLENLIELKCIYTRIHALCWPALKTLEVQGCNKVEILASQLENEMPLHKQPLFLIEKGTFPNLRELQLDLSGRMEIWHEHFHDGEFFNKLRVLKLHHFSKEFAISTRFVQSLANLEKLVVCESYQKELSINIEAIAGPSHELEVVLPFSFQHLKTLEMLNCDGLSPYIILPFPRFFQHLKILDMSFCDGLSDIFTLTIARNLVELAKLRISNCKMLTEVICDEEGEEGLVVAFNQLKYIELDGLTMLRCFSSIKYTLMFPLLEDVIMSGCSNMKFFSRGPIEAPKLERVQVSTKTWFWKENLNNTIQNMFEEMEMVATLKFIQLSKFPELIGKWHCELNPIKLSWQLKSLMVDKCPSFINAIPSKLMLLLVNMTRLQICNCESLEEIFDLEGLVGLGSTQKIPSSMILDLVNLPKLRRLWNKDLQGSLPYNFLYYITFYNCSNLIHAFNPSMAQCLVILSQVEIKECDRMEGVIEEEEGQQSALKKITFLNLKKMKLECLPNLTSFLLGKNQILECPNLIELTIAHCPKMSSLTGQSLLEIDHHPSLFTPQIQFPRLKLMVLSHMDDLSQMWTDDPKDTLTFEHLQEVKMDNCKRLENMFPHWVATSLTQLKELQVESCGLKEIVTSGDDTSHSTTAQFLFPQLTSLVFHDMSQLKSFCPNLLTLNWPLLMELRVTHCDKLDMSFVASMNKWAQRDDQHDISDHEADFSLERGIPTLERLLLVDKDIQRIHDGKFSDDFFGKPKALTLACFHYENVVFPPIFLLQRFHNLQSLEIFCSSFEDIFPDEGLVDEGKHPVLENLKELKLRQLPNLKHVWREGYLVAKILQRIGKFEVCDCPSLTTLFPAMTSFQNMTKLVVKNSSGLMHLLTISAITNLVHLFDMTIIGCERMKEVVANDGKGEGKVISLGKLGKLTLQNLPSLECFSSITSCIFKFPSMYSIEVEECPKMKIFIEGTLSTPTLHRVTLFRYKWQRDWEGDLNTTIQKLTT